MNHFSGENECVIVWFESHCYEPVTPIILTGIARTISLEGGILEETSIREKPTFIS